MGEKVKVSRELAKAIEIAIATNDESYLLWLHHHIQRTGSGWETGYPGCDPLDGISTIKFAEILINGYEVEETPEEKISRVYKMELEINRLDFADGMKYALETLGIKIKGIND